MNFLIIGLGSMGRRRIRCLKSLGYEGRIFGYDTRSDRRQEARDDHGITVFENKSEIILSDIDFLIISVPPDKHNEYIKIAIENKIPAFVEASVILEGMDTLCMSANDGNVFIAPSCTMLFHPAITQIKKIIDSGEYGQITNFHYLSGQYLPDWHPWEKVSDYYVSNRETGGAREIVPFELTWIVDLLGFPGHVSGFYRKTMDTGADIEDSYVISIDWGRCLGSLTVDVVSRNATRSLILNFENGQVIWNWDEQNVRVYDAVNQRWILYGNPAGTSVAGYNKNIIDDMYINELSAFIRAAMNQGTYPNTLEKDIAVLKILHRIEGRP